MAPMSSAMVVAFMLLGSSSQKLATRCSDPS